jgi:glycosyltransferase involved in cell wall biosynthesis
MDIICFSHLRWNFVYQRPQHLFRRLAKHFRVFFVEEPLFDADNAFLDNTLSTEGVWIIVPHLPAGTPQEEAYGLQQKLLQDFFRYFTITNYIFWYYTPMALPLAAPFTPQLVIYDCMDELSAFKNAPESLKQNEAGLFAQADLVFTGGHSLYEAKKTKHPAVYAFPSSIDKNHFGKARSIALDPADQFAIPHPRIGFFGVIDERMDTGLLDSVAQQRPDWHFILIGPTVKIDPATLPAHPNIHYPGSKSYQELPSYLAGWDVAMMPFALNESTRYISPTKTPEYLAGGKPVVSTPIRDVVNPYGENGLVYIAGNPEEFIQAIEKALAIKDPAAWLKAVDVFLDKGSWDGTCEKMMYHINTKLEAKQNDNPIQKETVYV